MYNRKDIAVRVNIKSIKGYTMRAIGALEDRIRKLEYYTVLNAIALDTKTLSVRDATGNIERFKNGIFADPFNDHTLGKTSDREYCISVDSNKSIIRPVFEELFNNLRLIPGSSSNIKVAGRLAMIDYDSQPLGGNPYATTYRNCTESYYNFKGSIWLYPGFDNSNETKLAAPQNVTIDIAGAFSDLLATGIAKDISTVAGARTLVGVVEGRENADGTGRVTQTSTFAQTTTTTVKDIAVNVKPINYDMGTYVKDVSILPYMRARPVAAVARGLKPNTRVYPYFDKVPVSQYCSPARANPSFAGAGGKLDPQIIANNIGNQDLSIILQKNGSFSDPLYTDASGELYFIFYLPANTFRAGERTLVLANVDDINATGAIITSAEAVYTSSSLSVTSQQMSFQLLQPSFTPTTTVSQSTVTSQQTTIFDPVGETFVVQDTTSVQVPGIYLSQIGVYFKSKSSSLGITCVVAQTTAGYPDATKVIGKAYLYPTQVSTSNDSSAETVFTFETPILLQSDMTYAFWCEPDGSNPDYEIWISEVGGTDKITGAAITQQPYSGVMVVSSNGKSWNIIQSSDIKFKLYRARFKYSSATAVFGNEKNEFITTSYMYRANTANPVQVGDIVYAANSANLSQVYTNTTVYPVATVKAVDELNNILYLENSNGKFSNTTYANIRIYRVRDLSNTALINATNLVANAVIQTLDDPTYHSIVPKFAFLEPLGTTIALTYSGTSNSSVYDSTSTYVKNESLYEFSDYERVIKSYSNEVALGGYTNGSTTFTVNLRTNSEYLSPVIDLSAKTFNFVRNLINNDDTNEHTRYGAAKNKYISKNVVLNQEAEDLIVYITGYRPYGTNIEMYGKFLNSSDTEAFDNKPWSKLEIKDGMDVVYSSPQDTEDFREYKFGLISGNTVSAQQNAYADPLASAPDPTGILTYYDTNGTVYTGFSTFGIKIILLSDDPVKIPTLRDVRGIALQM